jgi:hypothetical protein
VRAFAPEHVVVLVQWGEARECADRTVRELWGADGRYDAAQRKKADQAPLSPARELLSRNKFSASHRALS